MSHNHDPDEEGIVTDIVKHYLSGIPLDGFVKFPGLLVLQYLFFWNWKRIVDPHSWEVIVAGIACWIVLVGIVLVIAVREGWLVT
jgi:hypothetical protein